jgi:catechol 2,3-dioxygenase-like lactoylglutathione lyase family enzyme
MPIQSFAFVMYPVSDMDRAVAFYRDTLGLKLDGEAGDRWTEFDVGGQTLVITTVPVGPKPGEVHALALEVDDLAAFRRELSAKGIETPQDFESPVCWMAPVHDPDGNSITLHQLKSK